MTPLQANRERVGDNMVLARKCRVTNELVTLTVTIVEYYKWKGGACSQDVWPNLTPDEREFIQTGYTQAEWESIFSGSDEEETDEDREDREREEQEEEDHYYETREGRPADEDDPRGFFPSDIDAGVETTDEEDGLTPEQKKVADKFGCVLLYLQGERDSKYFSLGATSGKGWYFDGGEIWSEVDNEWNDLRLQGFFETREEAHDCMVEYINRYLGKLKEDEVDHDALDRERKAHESMLQRHEERRPQRERDLEDDLFRRDRGFA